MWNMTPHNLPPHAISRWQFWPSRLKNGKCSCMWKGSHTTKTALRKAPYFWWYHVMHMPVPQDKAQHLPVAETCKNKRGRTWSSQIALTSADTAPLWPWSVFPTAPVQWMLLACRKFPADGCSQNLSPLQLHQTGLSFDCSPAAISLAPVFTMFLFAEQSFLFSKEALSK